MQDLLTLYYITALKIDLTVLSVLQHLKRYVMSRLFFYRRASMHGLFLLNICISS